MLTLVVCSLASTRAKNTHMRPLILTKVLPFHSKTIDLNSRLDSNK